MNIFLIGGLVTIGLIVLGIIFGYNTLVRLKNMVDEAWSGVNVQLKRRYDLIPNLVAIVKQYSIHEREVLENVTRMRAMTHETTDTVHQVQAENALTGALKTLFAVAENYPDLKANTNFLALQNDLTKIEEDLQLSRRYYNGATRNYNIKVQSFPSNLIARSTGFEIMPFFELAGTEESKNPKIQF